MNEAPVCDIVSDIQRSAIELARALGARRATDIDNGALLCSAHHHMLHASAFTMRTVRGRPRLLAPPWLDPIKCGSHAAATAHA